MLFAEVLEVLYDETNTDYVYSIRCRLLSNVVTSNTSDIIARPYVSSYISSPIVGEVVSLIKAPTSYASGTRNSTEYYYTAVINAQASIHHNAIPAVAKRSNKPGVTSADVSKYLNPVDTNNVGIDPNFFESNIVQFPILYVGDTLILGRNGNSIRLSSTQKTPNNYFSGGTPNSPITIIRNSKFLDNGLVDGDASTDEAILLLTSGQNINFKPSVTTIGAASDKGLARWNDNNNSVPGIILSGDSITVSAQVGEVSITSKDGLSVASDSDVTIESGSEVTLNAPKIALGLNSTEKAVLGDLLKSWTSDLIDALGTIIVTTPAGPSLALNQSPQWLQIEQLVARFDTLLSDTVTVSE